MECRLAVLMRSEQGHVHRVRHLLVTGGAGVQVITGVIRRQHPILPLRIAHRSIEMEPANKQAFRVAE